MIKVPISNNELDKSEVLEALSERTRGGIPTTSDGCAPFAVNTSPKKIPTRSQTEHFSFDKMKKKKKQQQPNTVAKTNVVPEQELDSSMMNLSLQNNKRWLKPKSKKFSDKATREITTAKRCAKKATKQSKMLHVLEEFRAQMAGWLEVPLRMDPEQYENLMNLGERMISIAEGTIRNPDMVRNMAKSAARAAVSAGKDEITNAISDFLNNILLRYGKPAMIVALCSLLLIVRSKCKDNRIFGIILVALAGVFVVTNGLASFNFLYEIISSYATSLFHSDVAVEDKDGENKAQMLDLTSLTDLITMVLGVALLPKAFPDARNWLRIVADVGRSYSGVESAMSLITRLLQKMLDYAAGLIGFKSFSLMSSMIPKVDAWLKDTRDYVLDFGAGKMVHDQKTFDAAMVLEDRCYEILSLYASERKSSNVATLVRPLMAEVTKIRLQLQNEGVCEYKMRQAPLILSLTGESQIGKSRMLRPLVAALLAMVLSQAELEKVRKDLDSYVYARQPEHVFWDGYCGQLVCFLDEKDLVHESLQESTNANTDIIRMGNVFPNVLHMAGIEQKGNVYFRSKIIVATTNVDTVIRGAENSVRYPEAVANRIHFEIAVRVKPEFATEESKLNSDRRYWCLDKTKLPEDGSFTWGAHDFVQLVRKPIPGSPGQYQYEEGDVYSIDQLLEKMAAKYRQLERESKSVPLDDASAFDFGSRLRSNQELNMKAQMVDIPDNEPSGEMILINQMTSEKPDYDNMFQHALIIHQFGEQRGGESTAKNVLKKIMCGHGLTPHFVERFLGAFDPAILPNLCDWAELRPNVFEKFCIKISLNLPKHLQKEEERKNWVERVTKMFDASLRWWQHLQADIVRLWNKFVDCGCHMEILAVFAWYTSLIGGAYVGNRLAVVLADAVIQYFGGGKTAETAGDTEVKNDKMEFVVFNSQAFDPQLEDVSTKVWYNNYYAMSFEKDGPTLGWGFFSHGNTFNMCGHYINTWKTREYGDVPLYLKNPMGYSVVTSTEVLYGFDIESEEWASGVIPNCRLHSDIRPLMATSEILSRRNNGDCLMIRQTKKSTEKHFAKFTVDYTIAYVDPVKKLYKLPVSLKYNIATKDGDCGLPIFIVDPSTRARKFVGFHVAGNGSFGMCYLFPPARDEVANAQGMFIPRTMREIGSVPRGVGTSGASNILASPLHKAWMQPLKAPARLSSFDKDGERVNPMSRALERYDQPILVYDQSLVTVCARAAVLANTSNESFAIPPRLMSLEDAVLGVPGVDFMESVNRSTSPGYPWSLSPLPGYKGKERFFGREPDLSFDGPHWPALKLEIEDAHELLKNGARPSFYFTDSLKDELVKKEKARNGDTRMFCPSPIVYQILFRMYFGEFIQKFMESRIIGEHAVGVNVYSMEWEMLKKRVCRFGEDNIIAGDFKSFDALQSAQILRTIGEYVIETFADRENDEIRRILWMEVWDSRHIVGRSIYQWLQSLPSGHPGTTMINCFFVSTTMRMCWIKANDDDLSSVRTFTDHVSLVAYGDDNLLGVSDAIKEKFNQHTITDLMALLGLKYTPEDKSSNPPALRNIGDVEFLKRKFRFEPRYGRVCAPLRLETILEMPMWSKREYYEEIWKTNLENAVRELALHPREIFDKWVPRMVEESRRITNFVPLLIDRDALLDEIVKKEVSYRTQMNDIHPSHTQTLNCVKNDRHYELVTGRQNNRSQLIPVNTALDGMPWRIYAYPTRMGCLTHYPGHLRYSERDWVISSERKRPATNQDNNLMTTTLSVANDMAGTTQILNESGVKETKREDFNDIPQGLLVATRVGYTQTSIYDFLAKPVLLNTVNWNSQAAATILLNKSLPQDAFSVSLYRNKIEGFLGFRGTAVMRLQVNGQKFQAGRLLCVFIPQGNVASSYPGMRTRSLMAATCLPRIELDLATETEVIMEIPYISPTPFYNFHDLTGSYGRFVVMVYSPLATGTGTADADISLWISFKDVELTAPAFAQMKDRRPKGVVKGKNPSEAELAVMTRGSISGGLTALARVSNSMMMIPSLAAMAGPASWALNCMAGVASAFGYSKPTNEEATTKVQQMHQFNLQNCNGTDNMPVMGLDGSNKLSIMPGFAGTDTDEMALAHLVQIPAFVQSFSMTTSSAAGSLLNTMYAHPNTGMVSNIVNLWSTRDCTPLAYFTNFFDMWRGSLVITVKIVKTQFHSGRVLISYNPANIVPSLLQTDFLLREIIDIRETSEFRFVIPYTATTQYRKVNLPFTGLTTDHIGVVTFHVLNELVAPATVASSVQFLVELAAGPDYELACPAKTSACPIIISTWASQMADIVPAARSSNRPDQNQALTGVGSSQIEHPSLDPALYCIGEKCNSILQLLKRYTQLFSTQLAGVRNSLDIRPFTYGAAYSVDAIGLFVSPTGDYMSFFGPCFAYSRGSVRVGLVTDQVTLAQLSPSAVTIYPSTSTNLVDDLPNLWKGQNLSTNFQATDVNQFIGATIPAYQRLHARFNRPSTTVAPEPVDIYTSSIRFNAYCATNAAPVRAYCYRAAGDDFALGYFVGVPLITTSVPF